MRGTLSAEGRAGHISYLSTLSGARTLSHTPTNSQAPSPAPPEALNQSRIPCIQQGAAASRFLWVLGLCLPLVRPLLPHAPPPSSPHKTLWARLPVWLCPFSLRTFHIIPPSGQRQDQSNRRNKLKSKADLLLAPVRMDQPLQAPPSCASGFSCFPGSQLQRYLAQNS